MSGAPFPIDPALTGVVVAYKNADYIADQVLPRVNPLLTKKSFMYRKFDFAQTVTIPDTAMGRKSEPATVEFYGTETPSATLDYGLSDVVPNDDINQAPAGYDPLAYAAQRTEDLIQLDRERRVAGIVFNAATYPSANKTTLSGTSQWSDPASTPMDDIDAARDGMLMKPNTLLLGQAGWSRLKKNPQIIKAYNRNLGDSGSVPLAAVAEILEIQRIIVGAAWLNSARKGQAPALVRAWGKHAALLCLNPLASSVDSVPTFGATFQYGGKVAGQIAEQKIGLRGSVRVIVGESVKEEIVAADLGFFFQNAVA